MLITNVDALEAASTISFIVNVQGKPWVKLMGWKPT